jgi:hypothetical protein
MHGSARILLVTSNLATKYMSRLTKLSALIVCLITAAGGVYFLLPTDSQIQPLRGVKEQVLEVAASIDAGTPKIGAIDIQPSVTPSIAGSPKVPQPNSVWATRAIVIKGRNVTYTFGEGQPREVAIPREFLTAYMQTIASTGQAPYGYVTGNAESALKLFLDNPSLPYFIEKCYQAIDWYGTSESSPQDWQKYPRRLAIDNLMYVDEVTGLKEFDHLALSTMLTKFNSLDNPLATADERGWKQCLSPAEYTQHLVTLHEQLSDTYKIYSDPVQFGN